jgi:Cu/Ag efflux protein CusF
MALPLMAQAEAGKSGMPNEHATVADVLSETMTVESIDYENRTVILRSESGEKQLVEVSPEVKRLKEVKQGDKVQVQFYRAIAAQMSKHGKNDVTVKEHVKKAAPDERPGIAGRVDITSTVTVNKVDLDKNLVTITNPAGNTSTLAVRRAPMQNFIKQLKPGDKVDVTYTEAVAISLQPVSGN